MHRKKNIVLILYFTSAGPVDLRLEELPWDWDVSIYEVVTDLFLQPKKKNGSILLASDDNCIPSIYELFHALADKVPEAELNIRLRSTHAFLWEDIPARDLLSKLDERGNTYFAKLIATHRRARSNRR